MTTEWYYQTMGSQVGPVSSAELLRKVRAGEIIPNTQIRKNDSQWVPAAEVGGLFEEANKPVYSRICPYCGAAVTEKPPCVCQNCDRMLHRVMQKREASHVVMPIAAESNGSSSTERRPADTSGNGEQEPSGLIAMLRRAFSR
jgi:hypothetical protein